MKTKILMAATFAALAGQAFAWDDIPKPTSTASRSEVVAGLAAAVRAGTVGSGEAGYTPPPVSTLSRAQVLAETREAVRLGLVGTSNEAVSPVETAADREAIRMAGMRAIEHGAE